MKYFDAHCHLQMEQYSADRAEVFARMQELDMGGLVVGTDYESSRAAIELVSRGPEGPLRDLWATVGSHPNHPSTDSGQVQEDFDISKFQNLAQHPKVVAVGECGLDYFRSEKGSQAEKFKAHIALAQKLDKPLIVHCREAHEDCIEILNEAKPTNVVMHFFTGSAELARRYLDTGCYLSFPGPVTFTDMYDESIRIAPLDKILSETDSPFAAPAPYRGKRNEPAYVTEVVKKIAVVKGIPMEEVAAASVANAKRLFGI